MNVQEELIERLAPDQDSIYASGGYSISRQADLNDIRAALSDGHTALAVSAALVELGRAERLYPDWPSDPVHAVAVMAEEAGEAVRAANNLRWGHGKGTPDEDAEKLKTELVQTAAMCFRVLQHLPAVGVVR